MIRVRPLLVAGLGVLLVLSDGLLLAQVGPSGKNVRRVRPKRPSDDGGGYGRGYAARPPRRTRRTRPGATVKKNPAQTAAAPLTGERLRLAMRWLGDEAEALENATWSLTSLPAPSLETIRVPADLPSPPEPAAELSYRQRVTLQFVREDRVPFESIRVRVASPLAVASRSGSRVELEGPRVGSGEVRVELPEGWEFVHARDARIPLGQFPGDESRRALPSRAAAAPGPAGRATLFKSAQDREALRASVPAAAPAPPGTGSVHAHPTPAALGFEAVRRLVEVRQILDRSSEDARQTGVEPRRKAWVQMESAARILRVTRELLTRAREQLQKLEEGAETRRLLRESGGLSARSVSAMLTVADVRRAQYLAEAEWWQAQCENPLNPDREPALRALREVVSQPGASPAFGDVRSQLARYSDVAQREAALWTRIKTGEFDPRPTPAVEVTRHLSVTVPLRRTQVVIRFPGPDLRREDTVALAADPARPFPLVLENGFWRAALPTSVLKRGDRLRIVRRTASSELEAGAIAEPLDPYDESGSLLRRSPMRLVRITAYQINRPAGAELNLLDELDPVALPAAGLRAVRMEQGSAPRTEDGAWWLSPAGSGISFRLRPSPYPVEGSRAALPGQSPDDIFRRPLRPEEAGQKLLGRLIVDAVRLESPSAGHVGGVQVGASAREVEELLGGAVDAAGAVELLGGAVRLHLKESRVEAIELRRDLRELVGRGAPAPAPGVVTAIDYRANRLRARTGPAFDPKAGTELLVSVAGRGLPVLRTGVRYRAVVVDSQGAEVVCKLVAKDDAGNTVGDAGVEVLHTLPAPATGAVVLRPLAGR